MGAIELGEEIARQRKLLKMTQHDLAKDVCSQPALSMIERGEVRPTLENIFYLSLKLKKPIDYFLQFLIQDQSAAHINQMTYKIDQLMDQHQYREVYQYVQKGWDQIEEMGNRSWYEQYLHWVEVICTYQLKKAGYEETIISLKALLSDDYSLINEKDFLVMKIMNSIAFIHAEHQQYTESLLYYNKSLQRDFDRENKSPLQLPRIYRLRILYNKAKTLYEIQDYEKAVEELNAGIRSSREEQNISLLGNFYYYLGQCYEKLNKDRSAISDAYRGAEQIFSFLEEKVYLDILHTHKKEYL